LFVNYKANRRSYASEILEIYKIPDEKVFKQTHLGRQHEHVGHLGGLKPGR
jgi:hypothetical protein